MIMSAERLGLLAVLERWSFLGHLYMLFVIPLTWLVFAVTDIGQIALYLQRLFPVFARQKQFVYFSGDYLKYGKLYAISLAAGLIFMTDIPGRIYRRHRYSLITAIGLLAVFWLCVYCMRLGLDDPFLYFRF